MLRSIVVVLDETASSKVARRIGLGAAIQTKAELIGLSIVDAPWIGAPRSTPIGAGYYHIRRTETLIAKGREGAHKLLSEFEAECAAADVPLVAVGREGDPVRQIDEEADKADLIVVGRETNFRGTEDHDIGDVIDQLLEDTARPLIITPEISAPPGSSDTVLVAFDGSSTASRAMHLFILLGLADGKEVHIVSASDDLAVARDRTARGAKLFRNHGVQAVENPVLTRGGHADALLGGATSINAGMIVMGARGRHSLLRRALVGSTTIAALRNAPIPIFVHH